MTQRPTDDSPTGAGSDWATIKEAAEILGVSIDTMRRLTDEGIVPCWRPTPNAYRRYDRVVLAAYRAKAGAA